MKSSSQLGTSSSHGDINHVIISTNFLNFNLQGSQTTRFLPLHNRTLLCAHQPVMATRTAQRTINAVVVSAGLMQKTVKVRIGTQEWNSHIRKVSLSHSFPLPPSTHPRPFPFPFFRSTNTPPPFLEFQPHNQLPSPRPSLLPAPRRRHSHRARLARLQARPPRRVEDHRAVWRPD